MLKISDEDLRLIEANKILADAISVKIFHMCGQFVAQSEKLDPDAQSEGPGSALLENSFLFFERRMRDPDVCERYASHIRSRSLSALWWLRQRSPGLSVKDFIAQYPTRRSIGKIRNLGRFSSACLAQALKPFGYPQEL